MTDKITCEIYVTMNEHGDWLVGTDPTDLAPDLDGACIRVVKLTVKMAPPVYTEATVEVPDEAGRTEAVEAEAA